MSFLPRQASLAVSLLSSAILLPLPAVSFLLSEKLFPCALERNILVSAAAGSGKTATLVERIIERVVGTREAGQPNKGEDGAPVDIDRLLIVTFTRAAAAEMRERIGAAIEERRVQQPENKQLSEKRKRRRI